MENSRSSAQHSYTITDLSSSLMEKLDASVTLIGRQDRIIHYANRRACRDLGQQFGELVGQLCRDVFRPEFLCVAEQLMEQCEDENGQSSVYYSGERAAWMQATAALVLLEDTPCILLTEIDISTVVLTQYMTDNYLRFDSLLKLPNGVKLEEDINELAATEPVALIYFTLQSMRNINNLYGWHNGDALLMQIRDWLQFSEPRRAQVYRLEDGFAILGRGVTDEDAKDRAEAILRRFEQPWTLSAGGRNLSVYCSVKLGIVYGKYVKNEMRNLLIRTIEAPKNSRGYSVYDEKADRAARRDIGIRDALINSIHNGMRGFEVHYQPIVEAGTRRWVGVEALCRWTMPDGTKVPPDLFIHSAEQLGLIGELDAWVRKQAVRQCVALGLHHRDFVLNVNFSPVQKFEPSFVSELHDLLKGFDFPASKLNLEMTESARVPFDEENRLGLARIAEQGIRLSLDDFGTGYSTLENLINLSAHFLKIDKVFLDGIEDDRYRQYLLRMLADLSDYLDMQLIAEGVETEGQLHLLQKYDVGYSQGYLFSRPLTYDQLASNIDRFDREEQPEESSRPARINFNKMTEAGLE